jgi:myo-inositol-1(or 4)-monophosphatase
MQDRLADATILASRGELKRGDWAAFQDAPFTIRPMGSIAYKLALVAAGLADATWTLSPNSEWEFAAGVALVESAGGFVHTPDGSPLAFNRPSPSIAGLVAGGANIRSEISDL